MFRPFRTTGPTCCPARRDPPPAFPAPNRAYSPDGDVDASPVQLVAKRPREDTPAAVWHRLAACGLGRLGPRILGSPRPRRGSRQHGAAVALEFLNRVNDAAAQLRAARPSGGCVQDVPDRKALRSGSRQAQADHLRAGHLDHTHSVSAQDVEHVVVHARIPGGPLCARTMVDDAVDHSRSSSGFFGLRSCSSPGP